VHGVAGTMTSIADYALLGDCQGAALVARDGSVDWWCPARFDAPSVFTRLLDPDAGHWSIRPRAEWTVARHYVEGGMVLQTEFTTDNGVLRLTDALALGAGERGHQIGYASPHLLVRRVEAVRGEVEVDLELVARREYGLVAAELTATPLGIELGGGAERLTLTGERPLTIDQERITARFVLREGESTFFTLQHRRAVDPVSAPLDGRAALADTVAGWQSWTGIHQDYDGPYREEVMRAGLVLQALTYRPTGAVVAAPTTSLPEKVGGSANWDYRFGWLRDGSFTLKALWVAACPDEGQRFFDWIAGSAGRVGEGHVPIMFGAGGEHDLTEHQLDHLAGYADSRPVRVGNDAWTQKQLDVLGEVLECAWVLRDQLDELAPSTAAFLRSLADRAAATWREPDAGIWEGREGQRDYLTSKLMCWVAVDRAIRLADRLGEEADVTRWQTAREEIRTAILDRGWNEHVKAFTGAFDSDHLDAGVLLLPIVGFLPGDDERVVATLDAIERGLSRDALAQRWTGSGDEGAFVICSYWLAAGRAMAGQVERAKQIFETVTDYANDVGLLSEEIDLRDGALIGNFPQALSHIGLVNAAWAIAQAESPNERD
jgi:GH15 family glucan-1,4-alpha-glucosidase